MALITCENVSIGYEGQTVVKELNFSIERGDYLCIVGENGSGKSTLVKSLLGLKGADRGKIIYGDGLKKNEIGYLPQKNEEQKGFPASVYEVVLSGRLNGRGWKPFYRKEDKEAAAEKMEMLGITDLARQCFRDLSGGQQQRALLARALCATKSLLLLDEPVTGLDPIVTGEFYDLIRKINHARCSDNLQKARHQRADPLALVMSAHRREHGLLHPGLQLHEPPRRQGILHGKPGQKGHPHLVFHQVLDGGDAPQLNGVVHSDGFFPQVSLKHLAKNAVGFVDEEGQGDLMVRSHEIRAQGLDLGRRRQHHGKGSHRMGHQLAAKSPDVLIKQPHIQRPIHQPIPDIIAAHGADQ